VYTLSQPVDVVDGTELDVAYPLAGALHQTCWVLDESAVRHAGERRLQHELVVAVRLKLRAPRVDGVRQSADEIETYGGYRWWSVTEIETSAERF
jgi:hypothetical protein